MWRRGLHGRLQRMSSDTESELAQIRSNMRIERIPREMQLEIESYLPMERIRNRRLPQEMQAGDYITRVWKGIPIAVDGLSLPQVDHIVNGCLPAGFECSLYQLPRIDGTYTLMIMPDMIATSEQVPQRLYDTLSSADWKELYRQDGIVRQDAARQVTDWLDSCGYRQFVIDHKDVFDRTLCDPRRSDPPVYTGTRCLDRLPRRHPVYRW
jgi:hypothetical protein